MSSQHEEPDGGRAVGVRATAVRTAGTTLVALEQLAGGLGTALLALCVLVWLIATALACLIGVGLLVVPVALRALHAVAARERARLTRWGPEMIGPGPLPTRLRPAFTDPATRRELRWLAGHATLGLLLGLTGVVLPLNAIRDATFPLWWKLLPEGEASASVGFWTVDDWPGVFGVALLGPGWAAMTVGLTPGMARLQARRGWRLLSPDPGTDLSLRIAELTATRAAALDAHATELRRIERSLHDGAQNRLVAVTILIGSARRALARDPAGADAVLERAQGAAEEALAELRTVARGILPPVLVDRGLAGALTGLAADCAVPCQVDVDVPDRCAASVEATAYFVVAEALTNISRHSGAQHATVTVRSRDQRLHLRVTDDGRGGADERRGSGLVGIRRRTEAHDGSLTLASPAGGPTTLQVELPCGS
jgi:signal transduction histidine kinase